MKKTLLFLFTCVVTSPLYGAVLTYNDLEKSVCRIKVTQTLFDPLYGTKTSGQYGTGTVFSEDSQNYYILTNGHVTSANKAKYTVEFVQNGILKKPIPVDLQWQMFQRNTTLDAAMLRLPKANIGDNVIVPIKLASATLKISDRTIWGGGFPESRWLQFWKAQIQEDKGNLYKITMPPVEGQSGSAALINFEDNTYIIGLVTWRFGDDTGATNGGVVSLKRLYEMFSGSAATDSTDASYPHATATAEEDNHVCNRCGRTKNDHIIVYDKNTKEPVLRADGRMMLYCPDNMNISLQPNWAMCEWRVRPLPPGVVPNKPSNPGAIGNVPPGIIQPPQPPTEPPTPTSPSDAEALKRLNEENAQLKKQLDDCKMNNADKIPLSEHKQAIVDRERKIAELEAKIIAAGLPNSGLEAQVKLWKEEVERLKMENLADKTKYDTQEKLLENLKRENEQLRNGKTILENQIKSLSTANAEHIKKIDEHKAEIDSLTTQVDKLSNGIKPDGWDNPIAGGTTTKISLALLLGFLLTKLTPLIKAKLGNVLGGLVVWALKKGGNVIVGSKQTITPPTPVPQIQETAYIPEQPVQISSSIKQFIELKEKDGEDVRKLAIFGVLYREAVEKLKNGEFVSDSGSPLLSQEKIADRIEDWVVEQFYRTTTITDIKTQDELQREAMYGWLYQQAFTALRQGKLHSGVLNHVETAQAVDKWVKKEYLRRLKVN